MRDAKEPYILGIWATTSAAQSVLDGDCQCSVTC